MKTVSDLKFGPCPEGSICRYATMDFPNGYGASVLTGSMLYTSEGHPYEIAVTHEGSITYATSITDNACEHLSEEEANDVLRQIQELPKLK